MNQWFYAQGGQQKGPVTLEELRALLLSGGISGTDLVWNASMSDWKPAAEVAELSGDAPPQPAAFSDPAAYVSDGSSLTEITPGSEPIVVTACVKRGFDLVVRHIAIVLVTMIVYLGIIIGLTAALGALDKQMGWVTETVEYVPDPSDTPGDIFIKSLEASSGGESLSLVSNIISQLVSLFLWLGLIRFGLGIVSGKAFGIGQLFGEIKLMPKAIVGNILYFLMIGIGLILLIVPGIYLALRYAFFLTAMVDRNLSIVDSFKYSAALTTNSRLNLFVLFLFGVLITVAGFLAFCVGILFAIPVVWLSWIVAYRWLQYGSRAVQDFHGTQRPLLSTVE